MYAVPVNLPGFTLGRGDVTPGSRHSDGTDPWQPPEEDRGACMSL